MRHNEISRLYRAEASIYLNDQQMRDIESHIYNFAAFLEGCSESVVKDAMEDEVETVIRKMVKSPLGLMPRQLHIESRMNDIREAIVRYQDAGMEIPQEWIEEWNEYARLI